MCGEIEILSFLFRFFTIKKVTRKMNNFNVIAFQVRDKDWCSCGNRIRISSAIEKRELRSSCELCVRLNLWIRDAKRFAGKEIRVDIFILSITLFLRSFRADGLLARSQRRILYEIHTRPREIFIRNPKAYLPNVPFLKLSLPLFVSLLSLSLSFSFCICGVISLRVFLQYFTIHTIIQSPAPRYVRYADSKMLELNFKGKRRARLRK